MTNLKRIFLVMLVVILLGATAVFATQDGTILITEDNATSTTGNTNTSLNTTGNTNTNTNTNTLITSNASNYNNTNTTGTLPKTGENDIVMILAVGVFAVSAVYAYKKIRDYKNI